MQVPCNSNIRSPFSPRFPTRAGAIASIPKPAPAALRLPFPVESSGSRETPCAASTCTRSAVPFFHPRPSSAAELARWCFSSRAAELARWCLPSATLLGGNTEASPVLSVLMRDSSNRARPITATFPAHRAILLSSACCLAGFGGVPRSLSVPLRRVLAAVLSRQVPTQCPRA